MINYLPGYERHLRILQALSEESVQAYSKKLKEFISWLEENGRDLDPQGIGREDIENYLEWCFYKGNTNVTRRTKLIAIQKFCRYLVYQRILKEDVSYDIPKIKVKRKFVQKFTQADIYQLFKTIDIQTEKGIRDAVIIILGVFAGLRVGEIGNLRLHDIVDHGKSVDINIPEDIGKQEESRIIYLWKAPSMLVQRLMTIRLGHGAKESDTLIVTYRRWDKCVGKKMRSSNLDGLIKDLAEKAGIRKPRITMHMLRATHVEDLRRIQGYDIAAIAKRVGHKDISTTGRYMPDRERIRKIFPSLHVYWIDFINTLTGTNGG